LAISLQLFPASLICFNLNSSAGDHGVFVLPFFAGGGALGCSIVVAGPTEGSAKLAVVAAGGAGAMGLGVICVAVPDARRFLGFVGLCAAPKPAGSMG
jgi:hypothetical protein